MKIMKSLITAFMIFMLAGNTALAATETESEVEKAGGEVAQEAIVVANTYEFVSAYGYRYFIALCKNNSEAELDVSWDTVSYDSSGGILETGSSYSAYVSPGQSFVLYALFLNSDDADDYSYKIHYEDSNYIHPAYSDVEMKASISKNGSLILQATNTSDAEISSIQAATLFFDKNDELVGFEDSYIVNSNYNVEAGETVVEDINVPEGADRFETYITAYRW
ncbi:hypothetical protein [Butyrivibrio sp. AC2005]|uniref:hypothetical protein n=1 Tax=Butyrivibrio sp. AC2005 TaxID=1280672 RepID=UPI000402533F|nr:hypothetical protein [Butyrivibrio sp. AC2005]